MKIKIKKAWVLPSIIITAAILLAVIVIISAQPSPKKTASFTINETTISLEVADTPAEQQLGLMNRTNLNTNSGMIFIFPTEQLLSFWMKDTLIPLDIIFLNKDFIVQEIYTNTKPNQTSEIYSSNKLAKYVIEIAGSSSKSLQIRVGQKLDINL